jgi:hypothetical protein
LGDRGYGHVIYPRTTFPFIFPLRRSSFSLEYICFFGWRAVLHSLYGIIEFFQPKSKRADQYRRGGPWVTTIKEPSNDSAMVRLTCWDKPRLSWHPKGNPAMRVWSETTCGFAGFSGLFRACLALYKITSRQKSDVMQLRTAQTSPKTAPDSFISPFASAHFFDWPSTTVACTNVAGKEPKLFINRSLTITSACHCTCLCLPPFIPCPFSLWRPTASISIHFQLAVHFVQLQWVS